MKELDPVASIHPEENLVLAGCSGSREENKENQLYYYEKKNQEKNMKKKEKEKLKKVEMEEIENKKDEK